MHRDSSAVEGGEEGKVILVEAILCLVLLSLLTKNRHLLRQRQSKKYRRLSDTSYCKVENLLINLKIQFKKIKESSHWRVTGI